MESPLTLTGHLSELRRRIVVCLLALGGGTLLSLFFAGDLLNILKAPAEGLIERLVFFSPEEAFSIYMRVGLAAGFVLAMPVLLYEAWLFVLPALDERWKRWAPLFICSCFLTFIAGGVFAYFVLIPPALRFLMTFAGASLTPLISAEKYIAFVTGFIVACGLVFQMPVVSFILSRLGIVSGRFLREKYKVAIVVILVAAAVITPTTDVFNLMMMAGPMIFLYELSIWVAYLARRDGRVRS